MRDMDERFRGSHIMTSGGDFTASYARAFFTGKKGEQVEMKIIKRMLDRLIKKNIISKHTEKKKMGNGEITHYRPVRIEQMGLRGDFQLNGKPIRWRKHTNEQLGIETTLLGQCGR